MAAAVVTLNDIEVAGLLKCNPSNICAAFYTISTDNVFARSLCISRASCLRTHFYLGRLSLLKPMIKSQEKTGEKEMF